MLRSLHRTWVALALATLAVLVVGVLTGRDFVRHVTARCPGTLRQLPPQSSWSASKYDAVSMETVPSPPTSTPSPVTAGPTFVLAYDQKQTRSYGHPTERRNVRVEWKEPGDAVSPCTCGSAVVELEGEEPSDLQLLRERGTGRYVVSRYVVKGRGSPAEYDGRALRATFIIEPGAARHLQTDRIFTARQLPLGVVLVALGALGVALLRARRAMSYARTIHTWTPARLTPGGLLESESGGTLGTLEQTRFGVIPPGPVLVAPEALATSGLYRDVPIVARRHVAEGTHARWATGTMLRLRDARALAVLSTACTLLAFGARLIA